MTFQCWPNLLLLLLLLRLMRYYRSRLPYPVLQLSSFHRACGSALLNRAPMHHRPAIHRSCGFAVRSSVAAEVAARPHSNRRSSLDVAHRRFVG
uniref:Putative secreted protein n=1 Tax=Anopheles darlingi TaxID=43151 RepID=A0A2M4D476_ANODA